ncbi:hypothetical protein Tco_0612643 [Tanacetum coccineum]
MVKKIDGTWRMCIDFTSINKACPKDSYPLPKIDQSVESLEGFKLKYFLDTYKGYHQIRKARENKEKTSFHTEHGTFYYEKMSFGLKNARATYPQLMDNMFASQLESSTVNGLQAENIISALGKSTFTWIMFTDGASSIKGSGAGLILTDPNGQEVTYAL